MQPTELGAQQGMYRRATAATHERHASVLAIHFTLRVSNESLFHQPEKTDKMGIEQDVMVGAWTLPDRDRERGFPGSMEHRGKALPSVISIALYGLATLCAPVSCLSRGHDLPGSAGRGLDGFAPLCRSSHGVSSPGMSVSHRTGGQDMVQPTRFVRRHTGWSVEGRAKMRSCMISHSLFARNSMATCAHGSVSPKCRL
jgi:hypothetical protein